MDPLAQLKDIHLPEPVGLWPLAWGWWVLLALLLVIVISAVLIYRRHQQRNRYRAAAIAELQRAKHLVEQDRNIANYLQQLSITLRRAALSGCGTSYQANVKGTAWLRWLDEQCPETQNGFQGDVGRPLLTGPYEANPQADVDALDRLARLWLQKHRNQWQKIPVNHRKEKTLLPTRAQPLAAADKTEARDA